MLILLPPSEGKAVPPQGEPVALDSLAFASELGERRSRLLDALERVATLTPARALKKLALSPGLAGEIAIDAELRTAPAAAASSVYAGVLYEHLRLQELPAKARRRVLIASALWGVVRPEDRIPYYRFSAKARLAWIGPPAAYWREALAAALPDEPGELVVDMRSAAYAAAWKPRQATLLPARLQRERRHAQARLAHGKGGAGRRRPGLAAGAAGAG